MILKSAYGIDVSDGILQLKKKDSLWEALGIPLKEPMIVAFTGGGGKTTSMYCLADELSAQGKRVIVTTSTHILRPTDRIVTEAGDWKAVSDFIKSHKELFSLAGWVLVTGLPAEEGKLKGMELSELERLTQLCDVLLVEADGAKCLPIKIPKINEPVLPGKTHAVIGCIGLNCIGEPWEEMCFRYELTPQVFDGQKKNGRITPSDAAKILTSTHGTRKGVESMEYRILINKADDERRLSSALAVADAMEKQWAKYTTVTSFIEKDQN